MTAGLRRGARRREPNRLPDRVAAIWHDRASDLGTVATDLLGENRL